eukprot:gnl/TRDRNA2_/TRDRNA2_80275_c0_seq1.p1 gnl/TRDRNA2_/TRDRNA2_80275_c0~~gnl/TRDRNA2_/TRDRNA2_80275_c0_seq1.p1  ORF type:complete len:166 (+),score=33.95 gnl/TRDRNA2_/TRDRNA2_80275_c0_seq1:49-546(+)
MNVSRVYVFLGVVLVGAVSQESAVPCGAFPAETCSKNPGEKCYYDWTCSTSPPRLGGLGCNAEGTNQNCRFCGFKNAKGVEYPPCPAPEPEAPCGVEPAEVCSQNPGEKCYYDVSCSDDPPGQGGLGCNADGVNRNCRFCGFKNAKGVEYPDCPGEKPSLSAIVV